MTGAVAQGKDSRRGTGIVSLAGLLQPALWPALLIFTLVFLYPVLRFVLAGLSGLAVFLSSFSDDSIGYLLWNSVKLGIWTCLVCLVLGYPIAYYLARSDSRWKHYVMVAIFAPLLVSIVVRTFGWLVLLGSNGVLNDLLIRLGVISEPVTWLYNFPATVVGLVHVFLPFMVLSIVSSLTHIDQRLEEAASMLGARPWQVFYHVTLPLSAQGIFGGSAIIFGLTIGAYVTPRLLGGGRVLVLSTEIYTQMLEIGDWGMAALLGALLTIVAFIIIAALRLSFRARWSRSA